MDHVVTSVERHGPIKSVRILSATQLVLEFEDGFSTAVPVPAAFIEGAIQAATLEANGTLRLRFASGQESVEGPAPGDEIQDDATPLPAPAAA